MSDSSANDSEVNSRFELVRGLHANEMSAQELEELRRAVADAVKAAEALRSVKLETTDEPRSLFVPYRQGE